MHGPCRADHVGIRVFRLLLNRGEEDRPKMSPVNSFRLPMRRARASAETFARKTDRLETGYRPAEVPAKLTIARLYLLHISRQAFIACNREFFRFIH